MPLAFVLAPLYLPVLHIVTLLTVSSQCSATTHLGFLSWGVGARHACLGAGLTPTCMRLAPPQAQAGAAL